MITIEPINTERLSLTIVTMPDVLFLEQLFSFTDVKKYYVLRNDHAQDISLFTEYMVNSINNGRSLEYVIRLSDGTPVGLVGGELYREITGEISWNTGYAIHPSYQKKGYASEALVGFTEYIKKFCIAKSFLNISQYNIASQKVAENAGYKYNIDSSHIDSTHMELGILFYWEMELHSNRDYFFSMGCSAYQAKDYLKAEQYFQKALDEEYNQGPNTDALCYSNMGISCSSYGNYQKAFGCLMKAKSLGLSNSSIEKELLWLKNNVGLY